MKIAIVLMVALWSDWMAASQATAASGSSNAGAAATDSERTWDVLVLKDVMVPMRDGVKLATDLYVPARSGRLAEGRFPAVLLRTPYNKAAWGTDLVRFFAQHGYLSVTQDCRGRFASEGRFFPFIDDPKDGYDTIVWLAEHPLCNGKVGMHGPSYMAWVQFHAATQHPPGLVTMIPFQGPTNAYHYSLRCGGALHLGLLRWILSVAVTSQEAARDPAAGQAVNEMLGSRNFLEWAARIPWTRGETPLARIPQYEQAAMQLYFENPDYTAFWRQPGLAMDEHFASFPKMPILWVTSWFDWYPRTISDGYQSLVKRGREDQHLLVGPWSHNNFESSLGDVNFGNEGGKIAGYRDFLNLELAWFDRWMKDDRGAEIGPPVQVFMMGGGDGLRGVGGRLNHGGQWHSGEVWPPKSVRPTAFYLRENGSLSEEKPTRSPSSRTYRYDPRDTVSSNGRCIIAYGPATSSGFRGMGPRDQIELETLPGHGIAGRPIAERPDVLVYRTARLTEDLRVAGNVKVVLWVSSDSPDTDFFVKLLDEYPVSTDYPNGYAFPVSEGILRARYRESFEKPSPMKPDQTYRLVFPLEPTANRFKAGHRLRVDICSSNFPNFDINPNTGDPHDRRPRITWQHPENALFDDGAVLVNARGERFCDERAYPAREIAIANQPGKLAYILLDQHLAELYSRWPHFISTAPEIAYAYVADYLRLRPDVTVKADSLADLAQARRLPPQALTATVERFNSYVRGERSDAFGRTGDQVPLAGDCWILLGPVKAYFTTTEGGAAVNEQLQVLDAAGRSIDGLYAVGQNGLGGQILWGHGLHIAWALTSGRLVGQRLGSTADKGFPQAFADVPDSPASWLDRGWRS